MKKPEIEPEVGEIVRSTVVNRIYQGSDKPLAVDVNGTGNIEEALVDLTLGKADLADRILVAADPDQELPDPEEADPEPEEGKE